MTERPDPITYARDWARETTQDHAELQREVHELSAIVAALLDAIDAHQVPLPAAVIEWRKRCQT